jgi:CYTH domain-containing protein/predicted ATPase
MTANPVHRIVLTGGPCGGKTTALSHLSERLRSLGLRVFLVPEIATLLITGGATPRGDSPDQALRFQENLLGLMMAAEDAFVDLARSTGRPAVVICDRGTMDASAYMTPQSWQALLDERGWTVTALRDGRYDAVLHLVTAASGAEAFYTTANNAARSETPEEARALDARLLNAWVGHSRLRVVDNSTGFADKVRRVVAAACRVVGVPEPVEVERKFLVRQAPESAAMPVRCEEVEIEQTYLKTTDGSEARVRRRGQHGSYTYTHTIKWPRAAGERIELQRPISGRDYVGLLTQADPARRTIRKRRRCFLWQNQYFELDRFEEPCPGLLLLEAELEERGQAVALPPFLDVEREVTGEMAYSNFALAASQGGPTS